MVGAVRFAGTRTVTASESAVWAPSVSWQANWAPIASVWIVAPVPAGWPSRSQA